MPAVLAIAVAALSAAAILGLQLGLPRLGRRPRFAYSWLIAVGGGAIALGLAAAALASSQGRVELPGWGPPELLPVSPALALDVPGLALLVSLLALGLSVTMVEVQRSAGDASAIGRRILPSLGPALCAVAGLAVLADNLLALALAWTALDLSLLLLHLGRTRLENQPQSPKLLNSMARLASLILVVWAAQTASAAGAPWALSALDPAQRSMLLAAVGLRLLSPPAPRADPAAPSPLHTLTWIAASAPAWAAAARVALAGVPHNAVLWMLVAAGLGIASAAAWLRLADARSGLVYWILGITSLVIAAAARGEALAAAAWAVSGVLGGGMLGLATVRTRRLAPILLAGWLGVSGLPFTPAWPGSAVFRPPLYLLLPLFVLIHGMLAVGWARPALQPSPQPKTAERWVWLVYALALALLPAAQVFILWRMRPGAPGGLAAWPGMLESGLAAAGLILALLPAALRLRRPGRKLRPAPAASRSPWRRAATNLGRAVSGMRINLDGAERSSRRAILGVERGVRLIGWALEGRSGLLWALLVLVLLLSLLAQTGMGG